MKADKFGWINSEQEKPAYNKAVLVFIPEEDDHATVGMWDISNEWVLLDEYRIPTAQVTHWKPMVDLPEDREYERTFIEVTPTEQAQSNIQAMRREILRLTLIAKDRNGIIDECIDFLMDNPDFDVHALKKLKK